MSDYELYGDYNDIEEDKAPKGGGGVVLLILKIITALVCIAVIGVLAFRMVLFNTYPASVSDIYFNDKLTAYYNTSGGNIGAKTQQLRFPYDDEDLGNFFADHLIVIEGIDQLQVTVRYNTASLDRLAQENGLESLDESDSGIFVYRLVDNHGNVYTNLTGAVYDERVMYKYVKLVFDDVKTAKTPEGGYPEWIRLEITLRDAPDSKVYMIPIYENNEDFDKFTEYKLGSGEKP